MARGLDSGAQVSAAQIDDTHGRFPNALCEVTVEPVIRPA